MHMVERWHRERKHLQTRAPCLTHAIAPSTPFLYHNICNDTTTRPKMAQTKNEINKWKSHWNSQRKTQINLIFAHLVSCIIFPFLDSFVATVASNFSTVSGTKLWINKWNDGIKMKCNKVNMGGLDDGFFWWQIFSPPSVVIKVESIGTIGVFVLQHQWLLHTMSTKPERKSRVVRAQSRDWTRF